MAKCYASKVVDYALSQVGTKENPVGSNKNKYAADIDKNYPDFYNTKKNGCSWCDIFVDDCFIHCYGEANALRLLCQPKHSLGAGCKYSLMYYKEKGQFYKDKPQVGDQIFFGSSESKAEHTGLVYKVTKAKVYTVEGNAGNEVKKRSYDLDNARILGYGRPKYDKETATSEKADKDEKPVEKPVAKPTAPKNEGKVVKATKPAEQFNSNFKGVYTVSTSLRLRNGASTNDTILTVMSKGDKVTCYGYYSIFKGVKWLYVVYAPKGSKITYEGYCDSTYLRR